MKLKEKFATTAIRGALSTLLLPAIVLCLLLIGATPASSETASPQGIPPAPLAALEKELLSFFTPAEGTIVDVSADKVTIDTKDPQQIRKGMRFFAYREGAPFVHPVTKEPLGKIEIPLGTVEVTDIVAGRAQGRILSGAAESLKDARVKIQQFKIKVLFYQGNLDWYVGDAYYQILRKNDRVELIDTGLDIRDIREVGAEGKKKGADVILALAASDTQDHLQIDQQLFWASDLQKFSDTRVSVPMASLKELRYKSASFGPTEGEALLTYAIPIGARFVAAGDFEGKGEQRIVLVSGTKVGVYKTGADLSLVAEFSIPGVREILWIDTYRPPESRRDFLIITGKSDDLSDQSAERPRAPLSTVMSFVYEQKETGFASIGTFDYAFIRQVDGHLLIQEYSGRAIYEGPVRKLTFDGSTFTRGEVLKLPKGVNIYDFQILRSPEGTRGLLVWNENGFLSMYNDEGVRIWTSREDYGGFLQTYARRAQTIMQETEKWSVKDKLLDFRGEVLVPKRFPLLRNARTLGYVKSQIRSVWWSGMGVEERVFVEAIDGTVLDFAMLGDRIAVLSKPLFGVRAKNILKGENPFVTALSIYAIKGR